MARPTPEAVLTGIAVLFAATVPTFAQAKRPAINVVPDQPTALTNEVRPLKSVEQVTAPSVDREAAAVEDQRRAEAGLAPRFAITNRVRITPATHGTWETLDADTLMWRLRITSAGALSLNLGFTRYEMPVDGRLFVYSSDFSRMIRPFTAEDNEAHGELWTPVILADDIVVEVTLPASGRERLDLELVSIGVGYRGFGEPSADKSGSCNVDVVCPEGDDWQDEIASVAVIGTGGGTFCTGFMVNNTSEDQTPYFMTANHCGINSGNAASLVAYWNYENSWCRPPGGGASGGPGDGTLTDFQTGSYFRASYSTSDFTLVELDDDPNPAWEVAFAGWDRSGEDATTAIAIHHPNTDEKRISFEYQSTTVTSYLGTSVPGNGTHVRVIDWDLGTTEPGSSGSPLFNQDHQVIGQLHGGYAACGNDDSDWYGRFYTSWTGGGSSSSRLSDWLDSAGTGATSVDTLWPSASGMRVSPSGGLTATGPAGGPFDPRSVIYTVENRDETGLDYSVTNTQDWVTVTDASGYLAPGESADVTVYLNPDANLLSNGNYSDTVTFINETDHDGDTVRVVDLTVGVPEKVHEWTLDADPGWSADPLWAYGQPTGGGGQHGNSDPTSGHTGPNVYGYNLSGDYQNYLSEKHLTTGPIDCSEIFSVSVKFWRWLGVETPTYDHAYVRASNNGSTWVTVWENGGEITDGSWSQQEIDIAAVADGQSTVYLRWTMGTTDSSWQYCGWNIDDVEIWGVGSMTDCNNNGVEDAEDIATGTSEDCNENGVPDECEDDPKISQHPVGETACYGESITFSVAAEGYGTLEYQWRKDDVDIDGANQASYTIDSVVPSDAGSYDVVVTGTCGALLSDAATLSMNPTPTPAVPDPITLNVGFGTKNRYLSFVAGDAGEQQAAAVTITSLPGYEFAEGRTMWVQAPFSVTEEEGGDAFLAAELGCSPVYRDWSAGSCDAGVCAGGLLAGQRTCTVDEECRRVDIFGDAILPGGTFELRMIDETCPTTNEQNYSAPLAVTMSQTGDIVGDCADCPCTGPDGVADFVDITAVVEKFKNTPCASGGPGVPRMARADLINSTATLPLPDQVIDFVDIAYCVDGFRDAAIPLPGPPAIDPCQ
ncbi:MAG: trypsin-like peptidase domain-containing protein [Phycisphaerae bacterium]